MHGTLKKIGNSPYHICYECEDVEAAIKELKEKGYMQTGEVEQAVAISEQSRVCFLYKRTSGLIELVDGKYK